MVDALVRAYPSTLIVGHRPHPPYTSEIDVWPSASGPIVTHGYALTASVPFKDVCRAIGSFLDDTYGPYNPSAQSGLDFPVLISLECHVPVNDQAELARTMKETWGERLVVGPLPGVDDEWVTPKDLAGRIVVMVEYYAPALFNRPGPDGTKPERKGSLWGGDSSSSSDSESDEDEDKSSLYSFGGDQGKGGLWPFRKKTQDGPPVEQCDKISDELAELGYYARSMKPPSGWLAQGASLFLPFLAAHSSPARLQRPPAHHDQYLRVCLLQAPLLHRRKEEEQET